MNPGEFNPIGVTSIAVDQPSVWLRSADGNGTLPLEILVAATAAWIRLPEATRECTAHDHRERNHQGIDNRLIEPTDRPAAQ